MRGLRGFVHVLAKRLIVCLWIQTTMTWDILARSITALVLVTASIDLVWTLPTPTIVGFLIAKLLITRARIYAHLRRSVIGFSVIFGTTCSFFASELWHRDILADGDCETVTQSGHSNLFPLQSHHLSRQVPRVVIAMAELAIEVRTPCVEDTSLVDGRCLARFVSLLIDLNINEVDAVHANFLRRAENSELARTPDNELVLICYRGWEASSCHTNDIVDSQLFELEWWEEGWFIGHRGVTQAHLLTLIWPESIELALRGER